MLDDEFVNLVERAEKEQNWYQSNCNETEKEENKSEIEKLEATLNILAKKKKDLN